MIRQHVQILNADMSKAVSFPFEEVERAAAFGAALNAVFAEHQVNSTIGCYDEGAVCPRKRT